MLMVAIWRGRKRLVRTWGDNVQPGEEFDPTDAELRAFGDNIEAVEDGDRDSERHTDTDEADGDSTEGSDEAVSTPQDDETPAEDTVADDSDGTCTETVARTGDVCGRELPCPYHSDDD